MPVKPSNKLAVIGDPVAHSLSPVMQNAALNDLGLPANFKKVHVLKGELKNFLQAKAGELRGFNITLPHKENMLPLLDYVVPQAKLIGAVNTVLRHDRKWIGFNTDGAGYLAALQEDKNFNPHGLQIVILGAGGACRAIAVALGLAGARRIVIANRTQVRAKTLCFKLKKSLKKVQFSYSGLSGIAFERALSNADLLINTTSVGLEKSSFTDFPWQHLNSEALVSDIVYNPIITPFLKEARIRRHAIHTGEGMLVHQGALSLEIWTGLKPNIELMRKALLRKLKK